MAAVIFPESIIGTSIESGDQLYFYEVGTTTGLTVYTDFALSVAHANPIVADSAGKFAPIYLDATGNDPKVVLHDADDVEKWTLERFPIEDITTLASDLDTAESDIDTLEGQVTDAESDIDTLEGQTADFETRISQNETDIAASQDETSLSPVAACFFVGESNPQFLQNLGFSTVTKSDEGRFDLTFSVARANANYIVIPGGGQFNDTPANTSSIFFNNKTTTGFRVNTMRIVEGSDKYRDRDVSVVVFDLDA